MENKTQPTGKTLHLFLYSHWYHLINSGIKTEEYRETSLHWTKRFLHTMACPESPESYNTVTFHKGYTNKTMKFELKRIYIGYGKEEWGAKRGQLYFVIKLGHRLS